MNPLLRILDANANRAREALRVMEDIARFALDHKGLSASLKAVRHDLQGAIEVLPIDRTGLIANRDTASDVGTNNKTTREFERDSLPSIAAAAASRLTEALRSMEEAAKGLGAAPAAAAFETLRYRAYDIDRDLTLTLGAFPSRVQWKLCVLLTESLCKGRNWLDIAKAAIEGGADCLQLREKALESSELLTRAKSLVALARPRNVAVIINDRPDIALLSGAHGVHLGQTDLSIADVRALAGSRLIIGASTENLDQAHTAVSAGADYCGIGPMFPTTTKHKPRLAGPDYLKAYLADPRLAAIPHLAIGGITPDNIANLTTAGARGIAVSSCVCNSVAPLTTCSSLKSHLSA